jgi:pilus assembly protein CpaB
MNPRQRRGIVLMGLAALGALAVFVVVVNYVNSVSRQVGPLSVGYEFTRPVGRLAVITADDLQEVKVPSKWLSRAAIQSFDATRGLVATQNIPKGAMLQKGMAGPPPELAPGQVEVAIMIDAETGVAGKVQPGDLVDIYGTFQTQVSKGSTNRTLNQARVVVANAQVLAIGALRRVDVPTKDAESGFEQNEVVPVTFALDQQASLKVTYAESFAEEVRLALVAPGTRSRARPGSDVITQTQVFGKLP